jgi:glycosyltransferase involved in cell wall biosynthesis
LDDAELVQQMLQCDCLCLPSIERTEAFGMVLLEAMHFGKATVISDVPGTGMGWVVDDGITGIKVPPANADALAEAFRRLAANDEELLSMGQQGKNKFDQQFEINHAVEGLLEIYQQALN